MAPSCPGLDVTMASTISVVMVAPYHDVTLNIVRVSGIRLDSQNLDFLDCVGLLVDNVCVLCAEHSNLDTSASSAILLETLLTDPGELLLSADLELSLALVGDKPASTGLSVGFTLPKCHCNQAS